MITVLEKADDHKDDKEEIEVEQRRISFESEAKSFNLVDDAEKLI